MATWLRERMRPRGDRHDKAGRAVKGGEAPPSFDNWTGFRWVAPVTVVTLVLATGLVFRRHVFSGYTFPWDFWGKYSASPAFVSASAGLGHHADWVPFAGGGSPLAVDLQAGLYFPIWWLLGILRVPATISTVTIIQILHVPFGAAGVFFLVRRRGIASPWAAVGSMAYLFFGGFYGNAEHADIFRGFAYLPWLLWSVTIPRDDRRRGAIGAFPVLMWLTASGAYPGQVISFTFLCALYACIELFSEPRGRRTWLAFGLGFVATMAIVAAISLPYLSADSAGLLYRPTPADVEQRAVWSFRPVDTLGLYLSSFSWHYEGTIFQWAVGVPVLIGLTGLTRQSMRRHAGVTLIGIVAVAFAVLPAWPPTGRIIAAMPLLDASRFPASDFKAPAALALIVLASVGWQSLMQRPRMKGAFILGAVIVAGVIIAPQTTTIPPTGVPLLLVIIVAASVAVPRLAAAAPTIGIVALLALVVVDGGRMINDTKHESGNRPWEVSGDLVIGRRERDQGARLLRKVLAAPVARRPGRVPPGAPLDKAPGGTEGDALGYYGLGYYLSDFGGTITAARYIIRTTPELEAHMLKPWTAWAWPCEDRLCRAASVPLPAAPWQETVSVRTLSYGLDRVTYAVSLPAPSLVVENEVYFPGWRADDKRVRLVPVGGALRGWVLPAGSYRFTAEFRSDQRSQQILLALIGVAAWLAGVLTSARSKPAPTPVPPSQLPLADRRKP